MNNSCAFKIKILPYPIELMVSIGQTDKQMVNSAKLLWHEPELNKKIKTGHFDIEKGTTAIFSLLSCNVGVFRFSRNPAKRVIAHECFHATYKVMKRIGADLTDESEECYAYLLDYIFNEVCSGILK